MEQALGNDSEFLDTNCGKFSYDITFRLNVVKTNCPERRTQLDKQCLVKFQLKWSTDPDID